MLPVCLMHAQSGGTFSGTVTLDLQAISCRQGRDYVKAVLVMVEGCGSPVSVVGMARPAGQTVGRHSAGSSVGASREMAGLAPAAGLVASSSG